MDPSDHDDDKSEIKKSSIKIKPANIITDVKKEIGSEVKTDIAEVKKTVARSSRCLYLYINN